MRRGEGSISSFRGSGGGLSAAWDSGSAPDAGQGGKATPEVQRGFSFPIKSQARILGQEDPKPQSETSMGTGCSGQKL